MDRRVAVGLVVGAVLIALVLVVGRGRDEPAPVPSTTLPIDEVVPVEPGEGTLVPLYYPDETGMLSEEEREVVVWTTPAAGAQVLLRALLAGPESEDLSAPVSESVSLGETFLTPAGQLYVDLVSTELDEPPRTGSQAELLTVFSLVDTVLLNIPEIEGVILLWNGRQLDTFAGHVDTSLPLQAEPDLIRAKR